MIWHQIYLKLLVLLQTHVQVALPPFRLQSKLTITRNPRNSVSQYSRVCVEIFVSTKSLPIYCCRKVYWMTQALTCFKILSKEILISVSNPQVILHIILISSHVRLGDICKLLGEIKADTGVVSFMMVQKSSSTTVCAGVSILWLAQRRNDTLISGIRA